MRVGGGGGAGGGGGGGAGAGPPAGPGPPARRPAPARLSHRPAHRRSRSRGASRRPLGPRDGVRHVVVGTAGHIDHGKTSLVKALTGTDTDRLPEEKAPAITIDLAFAFLPHAHDLAIE